MSTIASIAIFVLLAVGILLVGGQRMQRLVISNLVGLGFTAVSYVALIVFAEASNDWEWTLPYALPWLLGGVLLTVLDLVYRRLFVLVSHEPHESEASDAQPNVWRHWLAPAHGASLIILPVWMLGVLLTVIFAVLSVLDFLWTYHIDAPPA